jgi:hypothetical protein
MRMETWLYAVLGLAVVFVGVAVWLAVSAYT